jgi:thiol-disulfide isomerase/thioredoxin
MRKTTIILLVAVCQFAFSQTTQIETKLKGIKAKSIRGEKLVDYDLIKHIKNKVVILEFWETWCGPCIQGMPHLKDLKDKFPNDLLVICISSDDVKKTSSYISEHSYPFDYVFDAKKQLSIVFPHSGIPHTILIDKTGKIQAETLPGYLSESDIDQLISENSIDLPSKKNFNPDDLKKVDNKPSLVTFELQNTELGDRSYTSTSTIENKKRIIFGYTSNAYKDTIENIQRITISGKNILELYQLAYKGSSDFKFIFPKELDYIKSQAPNNKYRLNYAVSNLFGNFNTVLIRQLNAAFGLETEKIDKDTTVIVLKKIEPNGHSITLENDPKNLFSQETEIPIEGFKVKGTCNSLSDIAVLLETKTHLPVEFSEKDTNKYNLDISIKADFTASLEEWLRLFEKEGIFLVKENKKTEFIRIKKAGL